MTLSSHIDPDQIENRLFEKTSSRKSKLISKYLSKFVSSDNGTTLESLQSKLLSGGKNHDGELVARFKGIANKYKMPENGISSKLAYEMVHDDLTLDGSTTLNLASFVNVHAEDEAMKLIQENLTKNLADCDEYPMMIDIQQRCISIISNLWNAPLLSNQPETGKKPDGEDYVKWKSRAIGTPCTGSSEAIMLGGLAMKKNWQAKRKAKGLPYDKPNILMASCCQVALEKFARYFDVENRLIGVSDKDFLIDLNKIKENLDENTIGIFVIVGSTYTGGFENVAKISKILDDFEKETGHWIPIHVDGASGGFIAPIIYPKLEWDFRIPRVMSINSSGHKFGLVTAGLGWVLFRDETWLPKELRFQLQYLGGLEESFSLNFSRPGYQVIHQYYNFIKFGKRGYYEIFDNCLVNARLLSFFLEDTGYFTCISNLHLPNGVSTRDRGDKFDINSVDSIISQHEKFNPALPVVSFQLTKEFLEKYPEIPQGLISSLLRNKKWIIPNYQLPRINVPKVDENGEEIEDDSLANEVNGENNEILRVVVKYNLTSQLLDKLMHDIVDVVEMLIKSVELVRENIETLKENESDNSNELIYNMLTSIANEGDIRLIKFRINKKKKGQSSFKGVC